VICGIEKYETEDDDTAFLVQCSNALYVVVISDSHDSKYNVYEHIFPIFKLLPAVAQIFLTFTRPWLWESSIDRRAECPGEEHHAQVEQHA
jgi:hypothetical protein